MAVDNFETIGKLLSFTSEGDFYFVQIIQRSKDNPSLGANNRCVKIYTIYSQKEFASKEKEIKAICEIFNARAYIHLTKRCITDVTSEMLYNLVTRIHNNQIKEVHKCFATACGLSYQKSDKSWVVDIDEKLDHRSVNNILRFIEQECDPKGPKFKALIPTLNGWHLITTPFNVQQFQKQYPEIDIHKNNPTFLYYKKQCVKN